MGIKIIIVAALCFVVVACGESDEGAKVTATTNNASDAQIETASEAMNVAEEAAAAAEIVTEAAEQSDNATSGEAVYKKSCMSCHMTGAAGAPKVGDASAWKPRIAKGTAVLVKSAITGVPGTAMMAKGTCGTCTNDDIKAAVEYMIAQSR